MAKETYIKKANMQAPYTVMYNKVLRSKVLSFESKGVLVCLLSLPSDWVVSKKWLLKEFPIKRHTLDKAFKELEDNGYICSFDYERGVGKFSGKGYIVYSESVKPSYNAKDVFTDADYQHRFNCENTDADLPHTVKQHLQIQETTKTRIKVKEVNSLNIKTRERKLASEQDILRGLDEAFKRYGMPDLPS